MNVTSYDIHTADATINVWVDHSDGTYAVSYTGIDDDVQGHLYCCASLLDVDGHPENNDVLLRELREVTDVFLESLPADELDRINHETLER